MDAATRFRLSLIVLLGALLILLGLPGRSVKSTTPIRLAASENAGADKRRAREASAADSGLVMQLDRLLYREPTAAEWRRVRSCLQHRSWPVVRAAFGVVCTHRISDRSAVGAQLLHRALEQPELSGEPTDSLYEQVARLAVMNEVLQGLDPVSESARPLLVRAFRRGPSGPIRARALELLARLPPLDWEELVRGGLTDPSQQVRLTALDIVPRFELTTLLPPISLLACDARPAIQVRASQVLSRFGSPSGNPDDQVALRAARKLAEQLWSAGFRYRDAMPEIGDRPDDSLDREMLAQCAEAYLDQSVDHGEAADDSQGLLLLAASARLGYDKLARRLWEHEVGRTDTDDELRERAIESLARGRLVTGLSAYARGDRSGALSELATIATLVSAAPDSLRVQLYAQHARELSTVIWSVAVAGPAGDARCDDPAAALANSVIGGLNLSDARHRAEARRRLEACCGLAPPAVSALRPASAMAN